MVEKWFKPKRHSGFNVNYTIEKNLEVMYSNTPKNLGTHDRWRRVFKQAQALANVNKGRAKRGHIYEKAQAVADAARKKLQK